MADRAAKPALTASDCGTAAGVPATEDTASSTRSPRAAEDVLRRADNSRAAVSRIATTDAGPRMVRGLFQRLPRFNSQYISLRTSLRTSLCTSLCIPLRISQRASQSASQLISRCMSDGTADGAPLHGARSAAPGASPDTSMGARLFPSPGTCRLNPRGMQPRPAFPFPGIKPPGALLRAAARLVRLPAFRRGHRHAPSPVLQPVLRPVIWPAYLKTVRHMIRPLAASLLLSTGLALSFGSASSAGALEQACNAAPQQGGNRNLCGCIQQVANLTLNGREQKLAAGFFKDPQKAQVMRQSARRRDETFWQKYLAFGESAALYCS